jgi:hypothetical protein
VGCSVSEGKEKGKEKKKRREGKQADVALVAQ